MLTSWSDKDKTVSGFNFDLSQKTVVKVKKTTNFFAISSK